VASDLHAESGTAKAPSDAVKLATWNVNSIRIRIDQVCTFLERVQPDVLCLQETKVIDDDFPSEELTRLGYAVAMAGQPTYNGVALVTRLPLKDVKIGFDGEAEHADKRLIAATIGGVRVLSAYIPNGKSVASPSFPEKLAWLGRLRDTMGHALSQWPAVAVCGDFNVASDERDVYDPEAFRGRVHFHPDERRALDELRALGLADAFRIHHQEAGQYSWWDYRGGGFQRNEGLRIDYVFLSPSLAARCTSAALDLGPRHHDKPSDHIPVIVEF
jgi:exodeoxyribonuclease-3